MGTTSSRRGHKNKCADSAPPPYVASSYRPASVGPVGPPPPFSSSSTDGGKNAPHYVPVAEDGARPSKKFANSAITAQDAKGRDYVLVVDCSGSMLTEDCPNDTSRWQEAREGAEAFAATMDKLDPDGIDFCLFSDGVSWQYNVHSEAVSEGFEKQVPRGGTILAPVLQQIFLKWFDTRSAARRPITVVIVTDGMPSDKREVLDTIVTASRRLAEEKGCDEDIGISFVQVGYDRGAAAFLKELDDDLQDTYGAPFDIVDTVPMTKVAQRGGVKQVLLDAVND